MIEGTAVASRPTPTAFAERVAQIRGRIDTRLAALVPITGDPSRAARHSLLAPGKRLRAVMTVMAAEQCGGTEAEAIDAACAVEMIHTASLVFDDLPAMDDAALRRGMATPHVVYGDDVAILAGIGLLNGAFGAVSRSTNLTPLQKADIVRILSDAVGWQGLVQGQALDLQTDQTDVALDDIHYGKTGVLFVAATLTGAAAANAQGDDAMTTAFTQYGRALGHAYQAFDDILDQVADDKVAGKSTGRDDGKQTAVLKSNNGRPCVESALSRAQAHLGEAKTALSAANSTPARNTPLADLADHIGYYFDKTFSAAAG